ncbi:MAG: Arc family DNA-binding protein [Candidatus Latescibacteria bacterium]|nr:Arc family DNA-binding protein [Candidatus Latescibacterota bacterium]
MANMTVKNMPDELYDSLKEEAARNRRSLNSEVIVRLESSVVDKPVDSKLILERARAVRRKTTRHWLSDSDLNKAKAQGRA